MSLSNEDKKILSEGEEVFLMVQGRAWGIAKRILDDKVDNYKLVSTLDLSKPIEEIGKEAYARSLAINLIQSWYNDLYAIIENHEENSRIQAEEKEGQIIVEL